MAALKMGAKRSLFKKPTWASKSVKTTNSEEEDKPIFGQNHLYQDILDAERRQRERHAAKRQEQAELEKQRLDERGSKRRRISIEAEDSDEDGGVNDSNSNRSACISSQRSKRRSASIETAESLKPESTPQKQKSRPLNHIASPRSSRTRSQTNQAKTEKDAIIIDGSETEDVTTQPHYEDQDLYGPHTKSSPHKPKLKPKSKQPEPESESEEEDQYLRELKAEARRKARQTKMGIGAGKSNKPDPSLRPGSMDPRSPQNDVNGLASPDPQSATTSATIEQDTGEPIPEVKIWIKTIIPNAKDLIVNRRIDQPLDKVREFWIKRNELAPAIGEKVFFTWNGTRLYNSTTMRGIIERLKKTHPLQDGSNGDPSHGQITIEAVTDEIFEYRQKQKQRRLAEADQSKKTSTTIPMNNDDDDDDDNDHDYNSHETDQSTTKNAINTTNLTHHPFSSPIPPPQRTEGIIIKLRAPGHDEIQLRVRANTTMTKILQGFCHFKKIDTTTTALERCWLSYDGDRLDPDATVEQCGFEHDDSVDVYLR